MFKLTSPFSPFALKLCAAALTVAAAGYAVVQIYSEAYLEGSRVGVSSQMLVQATEGVTGKPRAELTAEQRSRLDQGLEQALKVADSSEFALSWLQVLSKPGASAEFEERVQTARCGASHNQSIWMRIHKIGVDVAFYGPNKFELPAC